MLDLNLPRIDGLALCRRLREDADRDTPVLMLTARDTLEEKLEGFEAGADDYLTKPFELRELEARLAALHKRSAGRVARRASCGTARSSSTRRPSAPPSTARPSSSRRSR